MHTYHILIQTPDVIVRRSYCRRHSGSSGGGGGGRDITIAEEEKRDGI